MNCPPPYLELRCRACSWSEACGPDAMIRWLVKAKKVRPGRAPEPEILVEVFRATAGQLACPQCGEMGLEVGQAVEDEVDWPSARSCAACAKPIPPERLAVVPNATLCAACQRDEEQGRAKVEVEYCPRCGSPMELRQSRATGVTRYVLACTGNPPCRL
ncbi:MAG: TraR/DksA family transcriptional regulator [Pirellulales bacterium]